MSSPVPSGGTASQKRKLSMFNSAMNVPEDIEVERDIQPGVGENLNGMDSSASLGLEEGFLEVSRNHYMNVDDI